MLLDLEASSRFAECVLTTNQIVSSSSRKTAIRRFWSDNQRVNGLSLLSCNITLLPALGNRMEKLDRITQRPETMGGKACIRGIRVTVGMIVGQIGAGRSVDELLTEYPYLEREDILQALRYAAWRAEEREVVLADA
jgi:uncharacterized protein (DUF433 family)